MSPGSSADHKIKRKAKLAKIKQSPKLPAEERRQQLLAAARTLFMKNGYRGTTTEEIAHRAALTKGALYFHFKNKEAILYELIRCRHQELIDAVTSLPTRSANPVELLRALLEAKPDTGAPDFGSYLDFWVQASKIPKIRKYLRECHEEYINVFAAAIDRTYAPSLRDRQDLAAGIIAMYDGLTVRQMLSDKKVNFPRQLKLFTSLLKDQSNSSKARKRK